MRSMILSSLGADLTGADLKDADLSEADLADAAFPEDFDSDR